MTGEQLKRVRSRFQQTQGQMGEMLGVARNTIARWEIDAMPIPGYLHLALAELARRNGIDLTKPPPKKKRKHKTTPKPKSKK